VVVFLGVKVVTRLAVLALICVVIALLSIFVGVWRPLPAAFRAACFQPFGVVFVSCC
jgi:hypothetical protein